MKSGSTEVWFFDLLCLYPWRHSHQWTIMKSASKTPASTFWIIDNYGVQKVVAASTTPTNRAPRKTVSTIDITKHNIQRIQLRLLQGNIEVVIRYSTKSDDSATHTDLVIRCVPMGPNTILGSLRNNLSRRFPGRFGISFGQWIKIVNVGSRSIPRFCIGWKNAQHHTLHVRRWNHLGPSHDR